MCEKGDTPLTLCSDSLCTHSDESCPAYFPNIHRRLMLVPDIEFIAREVIMLKKGVLIDSAPPNELINKISGKVWSVPCHEADVSLIQKKFRVTGISRDEATGDALMRVISDVESKENAILLPPTIEDYYLYVFGERPAENI